MKTKCPNCGATQSLDSLLVNDGAREAILAVAELSGELGVTTIRYIGLFRPKKTELSFSRVAKLIAELLPHIRSQRLEFDGKLFEAPIEAWLYGMNEMLKQRELGKLKLPMPNHNYLYRIVSQYVSQYRHTDGALTTVTPLDAPQNPQSSQSPQSPPSSQMEAGVMALQGMKR